MKNIQQTYSYQYTNHYFDRVNQRTKGLLNDEAIETFTNKLLPSTEYIISSCKGRKHYKHRTKSSIGNIVICMDIDFIEHEIKIVTIYFVDR